MNKKLILASAIASVLAACGGGGGGGGSSSPSTVNGGASKGIVIGGEVNAYAIADDGSVDRSASVAAPATTGEDGRYSLTLNKGYTGGALLVEITAVDGTTMRCDLAVCKRDGEGNPTVSFGDDYALESDFAMSAMLPSASGEVSASITPLTSVAAELGLAKVVSGARPQDAAAAANAQVANRLGLASSDLTGQPIVDITNADALNAADKAALEFNIKSAAAVAASMAGGASVEEAVKAFTDQYKNGGMADREDAASDAVTLEEVLEAAQELLDKVAAVEGVENEDVDTVSAEIDVEESKAQNEGSTEASQGDVPDDVGSEGLQASKAFVKQLRNIGTAAILDEHEDNIDGFSAKVDAAGEVLSAESGLVVEAAAMGLNAISYAFEAVQEAKAEEKPLPQSHEQEGVTVVITETDDGVRYSVDQSINEVDVKLTALDDSTINEVVDEEDNFDEEGGEASTARSVAAEGPAYGTQTYTEKGTNNSTANMQLSGSASNNTTTFTIAEGSVFQGTLAAKWDSSETEKYSENSYKQDDVYNDDFTITGLKAIIDGSIATTVGEDGADTVTFRGGLSLKVDRFDSTYSEESGYESNWGDAGNSDAGYYKSNGTVMIDGFELSLSGGVATNGGDAFNASLAVKADGIHEICTDDYSYSWSEENGFSESGEGESCNLQESAQKYASASIAISFDLALAGETDVVTLTATGQRSGLEEAKLNVELVYGGNMVGLEHTADLSEDAPDGGSLTVTNHNDVVMTLTEDEEGVRSGLIEKDGVKYADIDEDAGAPVVTYTDGTFETF